MCHGPGLLQAPMGDSVLGDICTGVGGKEDAHTRGLQLHRSANLCGWAMRTSIWPIMVAVPVITHLLGKEVGLMQAFLSADGLQVLLQLSPQGPLGTQLPPLPCGEYRLPSASLPPRPRGPQAHCPRLGVCCPRRQRRASCPALPCPLASPRLRVLPTA